MAFGSSKTSCYLGCQHFFNLDLCWLVFCLGFSFGPLPGWTWMLPLAFFIFLFKFILVWHWKIIQRDRRQEKSEYPWPQECSWMLRVSMAMYQPTTTAKHLWSISKLFPLSWIAFWMHPQYSVLVLPLINRTSVSWGDCVCTEKLMGKLCGWSSPESGGEWSYKPVGGQSQVEIPRAHYWGRSCLISLLMIWMSGHVYPK